MRSLLAALSLALAGCYQVDYPPQPKQTAPVVPLKVVTLRVTWASDVDDLRARCKNDAANACAEVWPSEEGSLCWIVALPPKDFNDTVRLALIGHELAHCYMARHE